MKINSIPATANSYNSFLNGNGAMLVVGSVAVAAAVALVCSNRSPSVEDMRKAIDTGVGYLKKGWGYLKNIAPFTGEWPASTPSKKVKNPITSRLRDEKLGYWKRRHLEQVKDRFGGDYFKTFFNQNQNKSFFVTDAFPFEIEGKKELRRVLIYYSAPDKTSYWFKHNNKDETFEHLPKIAEIFYLSDKLEKITTGLRNKNYSVIEPKPANNK